MSYQIQFKNLQVINVKLAVGTFEKMLGEGMETSFSFTRTLGEADHQLFAIIFDLHLKNKKKGFKLDIEAIAHFHISEPVGESFKDSPFMLVNAPAIAFPYLRAFLSTFMLNAGFEPIMLPSYNFTKFIEADNKQQIPPSTTKIRATIKRANTNTDIKKITN